MVNKIGYQSYVGYCDEASFGTSINPTGFVEYNSESFKKDITEKLIDAINGTVHYKKRVTLDQKVGGSISFPLVPGAALRLLKDGIGDAITQTVVVSGVYKYVFIAGITSLTSMSIETGRNTTDTSSSMRYTGCCIDSLKFSASLNNLLMVDVAFKGQDEIFCNTISTASYRTLNPYTYVNGSIKIGDSSASNSLPVVETWNLEVKNNLQEIRQIGSSKVAAFVPGMQDVTYDITAQWNDNYLYNRFVNGTQSYLYAKFDNGQTIGTTTYTNTIQFESFKCYFNGSTPNVSSGTDILKASYPIRSIWNDGSSTTLLITVQTDVATFTTA